MCAVGLGVGCSTAPPPVDHAPPTYAVLARRYNARIASLQRLRASLVVVYSVLDESGRPESMQGDGQLAVVPPDRLMCRVTHIGRSGVILWAGSDDRGYWLYDGRERSARKLYYGRHSEFGRGAGRELAVPLHPRHLPMFLGMLPLPAAPPGPAPVVRWHKGFYLLRVPGMPVRLWMDAKNDRIARVDVLDRAGRSRVRALLSDYEPVEQTDRPPGAWPRVPRSVRIIRPESGEELRLKLGSLRDSDIKDTWFDLNLLMDKLFRVPAEGRIDVDER